MFCTLITFLWCLGLLERCYPCTLLISEKHLQSFTLFPLSTHLTFIDFKVQFFCLFCFWHPAQHGLHCTPQEMICSCIFNYNIIPIPLDLSVMCSLWYFFWLDSLPSVSRFLFNHHIWLLIICIPWTNNNDVETLSF